MNLNPIDLNYQDGLNIYPLQDYIDDKINEITNDITSGNIQGTKIYSSNIILNNYKSLSNYLYTSNDNNNYQHLYLRNNNPFGEIRFSTAVNYPNNNIYNYGTKIDYTGKLFVYHNYNVLQPTFSAGWYDVEEEILGLKADGINTDLQLSGLEGTVVVLQNEIDQIELQLINLNGTDIALQNQIDTLGSLTTNEIHLLNDAETVSSLIGEMGSYILRNKNYTTEKINEGIKWALGGAVVGAVGAIGGYIYNQQMSNLAYKIEPNNFTLTNEERRQLLDLSSNADKDFTSNFGFNMYNLSVEQGFINSNILTTQLLPFLNTNEIKINDTNISNIFVASNISSNLHLDYGFINTNITNNQTIPSLNTNELKINNTNVSNIFIASNISSNLHLNYGFINSNITNKQLIPNFYTNSSIGIGIQNPVRNIHIHNPSTNSINGIQITDGNSGSTATDGFSILKLANNDCTIYNNEGANLYLGVGGVEEVRITSTGVGIGGINPVVGLEVSGTNATVRAIDTTATRVARLELVRGSQTFGNDVYTDWRIENNADNLRFYRQNNVPLSGNALSILNDGKVGVGLDTPNEELEVNGNVKIDGGNGDKIYFGFDTTNNYRHFISTNHDSSATNLNYIRFGVWRNGQTATTLGDRNCLTLHADYNLFHSSATATNKYTYFNDETTNKNAYVHSTCPLSIFNRIATSTTVLTQQPILHLSREGTSAQSYGARASFTIGRWENNGTNSRTRLDLNLTNLQYTDEVNVMSWRSDGRVGINKNNPTVALDVTGAITASAGITGTAGSLTSLNLNSGNITNGGTITATSFSGSLSGNATGLSGNPSISVSGITLTGSGSISSVGTLGATTLNVTDIVPSGSIKGNCIANFHNGNPSAVPSGYMAKGSLTIGDTANNYGGAATWSSSTAGLLMECADNTEIIVHDAGHRLTSLLYYQGGGSYNNIYIGRDCGWGIPNYVIIPCTLQLFGEWYISKGQPSGVDTVNSMIFSHIKTGFNSKWWFNGTQTGTSSEISDERIKKEIKEIENPIEKLMKIKIKDYHICDEKDYIRKFGIIAQELNQEEELKEFIYKDEDYIANIYSKGIYNNKIIRTEKSLNGLIEVGDELKILLDNNKNNLEIIIDDTPYNNRYKKRYAKVLKIIDDYSFEIENELEENELFIYGKKTDDFLKLDYKSLFCLNIKATQELNKKIKELEAIINKISSYN